MEQIREYDHCFPATLLNTLSVSLTYDIFGNVATTVGPLGSSQTATYAWDADRQPEWVIGPQASGASIWPGLQYIFNAAGQITSLQQGTVTSASSFTGFTPTVISNSAYDPLGRLLSSSLVSGTTPQTLSYAYDAAGNRAGVTWPDTSNPLTATYVYDPREPRDPD